MSEPIVESLRDAGIHVERRVPDAGPVPQMIGSLIGSIAGQTLAGVARLGPLGALVGLVGGAVLGHYAVTHKVQFGSTKDPWERPASPAKHSDRR